MSHMLAVTLVELFALFVFLHFRRIRLFKDHVRPRSRSSSSGHGQRLHKQKEHRVNECYDNEVVDVHPLNIFGN